VLLEARTYVHTGRLGAEIIPEPTLTLHGFIQGFDNSGRRGSANWATDQRNVDRTRGVVQSLAGEFSNSQYYGVVTAIVGVFSCK
jgi:hypothetical protein